jgi:hypothetical protein
MRVVRFPKNPIVVPNTDERMGSNVNGPSLIRVPDWVTNPLGRYYLYFAHHQGQYIRLVYADELRGPWFIHTPGVLALEDSFLRLTLPLPTFGSKLIATRYGCITMVRAALSHRARQLVWRSRLTG